MANNVFGSMSPGKTGDMTAYEPSLREQIAWAAANMFGNTRYGKQDIANKIGGGLDIVPGVGDVVGFNDAKRSFGRGAYGKAAAEAGTSLIGLIPGGGDLAAGAAKAIFGGMAAKTADRVMLSKAEEMAKSGADRGKIWDATGWFKGPDDKWRFEIDDSSAKWTGPTTVHEEPSSQVYSHPELYQSYPELGWLPHGQQFASSMPDKTSAMYATMSDGTERILTASGQTPERYTSQMPHELQHAVQEREGFAKGGLPSQFQGSAHWKGVYDNAWTVKNRIENLGETPQEAAAYIAKSSGLDEQQLAYLAETYSADELRKLVKDSDPYEQYRRLAGEVEARNVQARMKMTPEQRRAAPPWATQDVPDELQIIRRK